MPKNDVIQAGDLMNFDSNVELQDAGNKIIARPSGYKYESQIIYPDAYTPAAPDVVSRMSIPPPNEPMHDIHFIGEGGGEVEGFEVWGNSQHAEVEGEDTTSVYRSQQYPPYLNLDFIFLLLWVLQDQRNVCHRGRNKHFTCFQKREMKDSSRISCYIFSISNDIMC